uniref:Uncharacterized protein n=1 Tax=Rhizophora mucronata TaxID=61149 RepID=A0A2P2N839_RHIMU
MSTNYTCILFQVNKDHGI